MSIVPGRFVPLSGETAGMYNERVGGLEGSEAYHIKALMDHYGMDEHEAKALSLQSRSFWTRFLTERAREIHARNGARYGAINFARRKVDWPIKEIEALVDSIGEWKR